MSTETEAAAGSLHPASEAPHEQPVLPRLASVLTDEKLKQLYARLLMCEMVEAAIRKISKGGKKPLSGSSPVRREALLVGSMFDLLPQDWIAPLEGDLTGCFLKGMTLSQVFESAKGSANARSRPLLTERGHTSLNIIASSTDIGTHLEIATGVALACKSQPKPAVTVVFAESRKTAFGEWRDALRFASAHKLPITYVAHMPESARRSSPASKSRMASADLTSLALSCGLPGIPVDGNDLVAIYRVASEAQRHARNGYGPALLECKFFPAKKTQGRGQQSVRNDERSDPIAFMQNYLERKGLWSEEWHKQLAESFAREIQAALEASSQ